MFPIDVIPFLVKCFASFSSRVLIAMFRKFSFRDSLPFGVFECFVVCNPESEVRVSNFDYRKARIIEEFDSY